ncbi:MAG: hypothetical protein H7248_04705 [Microbacteriaceae bacterium]|nr:hypothetical protein [Microbacteriaceae bacterium]
MDIVLLFVVLLGAIGVTALARRKGLQPALMVTDTRICAMPDACPAGDPIKVKYVFELHPKNRPADLRFS